MKLVGLASVVAAAVLGALPVAGVAAAPAHADCGDPGQPACTGPVPTADEVVSVLSQLTDPNIPDPAKAALVQGGSSSDELGQLDQSVNGLNAAGSLPLAINVTDIQPAPNDLAGVTVSVTGHHIPIPVVRPMVLTRQGDSWLLTHDSFDPTLTQELKWILDRVGGPDSPGGNVPVFGW